MIRNNIGIKYDFFEAIFTTYADVTRLDIPSVIPVPNGVQVFVFEL